ncbi:MAG TPA: PQQ-binding-like beta-propeller repeat protein [Polyangiaceae bacterium]
MSKRLRALGERSGVMFFASLVAGVPLAGTFACSRTELELGLPAPEPSVVLRPDAGPPIVHEDAGPPAPAADAGPIVHADASLASWCTPALLQGAATPMADFCSTRANLAPGPAPVAPSVAWQVSLPAPLTENYDFALVVDDQGRTYTTGSLQGPTRSNTIVAIDEDGATAWSVALDGGGIRDFFLAADGTIHAHLDASLVVVGRDGKVQATYPLPAGLWSVAVGQDGSLHSWITNSDFSQIQFTRLSPTGVPLWTSAPIDSTFASEMALQSDGHSVVVVYPPQAPERLLELDENGNVVWQMDVTVTVGDPAIAPDGTVRVVVGEIATTDPMHLLSIDRSGTTLWDTDLGVSPIEVWGSRLAIDQAGDTLVHWDGGVLAVGPDGVILWRKAFNETGNYAAFVGSNGIAVVCDGETYGIDMATGATRWTLTQNIYPPIALAPSGAIVGTLGGNVVLARD